MGAATLLNGAVGILGDCLEHNGAHNLLNGFCMGETKPVSRQILVV